MRILNAPFFGLKQKIVGIIYDNINNKKKKLYQK